MQSKATTPDEYIAALPDDRKEAIEKLRSTFSENLPKGFEEGIYYGMLTYFVPFSTYPSGYHCDPKNVPLPFVSLVSQKNFIALYHMGIYANPELLNWFVSEFPKHSKQKLDMGKSCIRFKKMDQIPYDLIAELLQKISVEDWISTYEKQFKK